MHKNSLKAYKEEKPKLSRRANEIYEFIKHSKQSHTDRDIMHALWFDEPNQVRPRITELLKIGLIQEDGNIKDKKTNKTVRKVKCQSFV